MFVRGFLIASLTLLGLGNMGFTQPAAPPLAQDENRIDELIHKLGSSKFQERRAAQKELEAIGARALAPLKKFQGSTDPEISKRCGDLVRAIEEKVLTARLLAPKRVQVNFTGLPALHAVAELTKQSGYLIQVRGDRTKLAGKKTSLPAGELTFWQAFDQLCDDIGLAEQTGVPQDQHAAELIGAGGRVDRLFMDNLMAGAKSVEIVAIPGTPKNRNVSYAGAVRSRIYARDGKANGEYQLTLEVSAEPGLQEFTIVGAPASIRLLTIRDRTSNCAPRRHRQIRPRLVLAWRSILFCKPPPVAGSSIYLSKRASPLRASRNLPALSRHGCWGRQKPSLP